MSNRKSKKIYIVHQYYAPDHFHALYCHCNEYGYNIEDYIVLSMKSIISLFLNDIKAKRVRNSFSLFFHRCFMKFKLFWIKNQIIIVGLAPFDYFMNFYQKTFKNNYSIYFSSSTNWNSELCERGKVKNKIKFMEILKNNFAAAACVSYETYIIVKEYVQKVEIVNHSIETRQYQVSLTRGNKGKTKYIFLGKFTRRKNIEIIFKWINNNKIDGWEIYFAGDGELLEDIYKVCESNNNVFYLGKLSKDKIKKTLCDYDFLILPSWEEPFGIVLIEALSAGLPCIVSNANGPTEIIENGYNGFVFELGKDETFYKLMNKTVNMDNYMQLHQNAIISSKKYDSCNVIKQWLKILK